MHGVGDCSSRFLSRFSINVLLALGTEIAIQYGWSLIKFDNPIIDSNFAM